MQFSDRTVLYGLGSWYALAGLWAFVSFACDKRAARKHRRRTPERHLHLLELLGGFPGAWLAILFLRHKSSNPSFLLISVLTSATNIVLVAGLLCLMMPSFAAS
ncbi:MAG TPA: DUF1294 domain-containing protein [Phycisphaerales bacterium]|nr:DUF1294 domain-containing protein [Phycisphaerales bacterium]